MLKIIFCVIFLKISYCQAQTVFESCDLYKMAKDSITFNKKNIQKSHICIEKELLPFDFEWYNLIHKEFFKSPFSKTEKTNSVVDKKEYLCCEFRNCEPLLDSTIKPTLAFSNILFDKSNLQAYLYVSVRGIYSEPGTYVFIFKRRNGILKIIFMKYLLTR